MSEIEKYYNGEIIVDFEEETELEKEYNKLAELYSKAIHKKIEYKHRIDKAIEYIKSDSGIKLFNSISSRQQWYNDLLDILRDEDEDTPKEDKKIEKLGKIHQVSNKRQQMNNYIFRDKINEIIDRLNGEDNEDNNDTNNK